MTTKVDVRHHFQCVGIQFQRLCLYRDDVVNPNWMLEAENVGHSFDTDLVRAKFSLYQHKPGKEIVKYACMLQADAEFKPTLEPDIVAKYVIARLSDDGSFHTSGPIGFSWMNFRKYDGCVISSLAYPSKEDLLYWRVIE